MKKITALILVSSLLIPVSVPVFAQDMQDEGNAPQMAEQGMQDGGMKRGGKHRMMGGGKETVVATSDGGVVILAGPKLIKYDKDLNLVKEVEIKKGKKPVKPEGENTPADAPVSETAPLPVV